MPSCTVEGVFGIARTTGTPGDNLLSIRDVGMAAAIVSTVCSGRMRPPISPSRPSMSCGFTATTTSAAPAEASRFDSVAATPWRSTSSSTRSCRLAVAAISPGSRQPDERSPMISASPIRPAPRIATFRPSIIAGV